MMPLIMEDTLPRDVSEENDEEGSIRQHFVIVLLLSCVCYCC